MWKFRWQLQLGAVHVSLRRTGPPRPNPNLLLDFTRPLNLESTLLLLRHLEEYAALYRRHVSPYYRDITRDLRLVYDFRRVQPVRDEVGSEEEERVGRAAHLVDWDSGSSNSIL